MSAPARAVPRLHVVTDDATLARAGWTDAARNVLAEGAEDMALHVRGPRTDGRTLFRLVSELAGPSRAAGAVLVANDRVDVSLTCGLGAVHLGRRSLPVSAARALLGPDARIGVSCHEEAEVVRARRDGADWIFAGTIFRTPSHEGVEGRGMAWLEAVAHRAGPVPVLGIGGIRPEHARELVSTGACGVAVLRGVWDAPDPVRAVREYIDALAKSAGPEDRPPADRGRPEESL